MRNLIVAAALAALMGAASAAHAARYFETHCYVDPADPAEYVLSIDTETHGAGGFRANGNNGHVVGSFRYVAGKGTYVTFPKVMWFVADEKSGLTCGAGSLSGSNSATAALCDPFRAVTYDRAVDW